jgi:hypothetical protein
LISMPESVKWRGSSGPTIGAMVGLSGRVATALNDTGSGAFEEIQ